MTPLTALPPRESAVAACARSLKESILKGDLPAGSALPPERALAVTFGVNRLTLRAAIAQLSAAGLISVRHGSGNVVRAFSEEGGTELLPTLISLARDQKQWKQVVGDMLLVRRSLARAVVERLGQTIDGKGLLALHAAVDAFEAVAAKPGVTPAEVGRADQLLVRTLVGFTGTVLALAANPIFRLLDSLPELNDAMFADPLLNVAAYRALVDGLERKDPTLGAQMVAALEGLDAALLKRLKRRTP